MGLLQSLTYIVSKICYAMATSQRNTVDCKGLARLERFNCVLLYTQYYHLLYEKHV